MTDNVPAIDRTVQQTREWVHDIAGLMGTEDQQAAYAALRGVLHTVRDRLQTHEAVHLSAQLPALVRGIYFEGWHPADKPLTYRGAEEFMDRVREDAPHLNASETERAVRAVFTELGTEIDAGQTRHVQSCLPDEILELWPRAA